MAHKKHGLFTLIKVGIVAFLYISFYEHIFFEKNPRYDKLQHTTYIMLILWLIVLFLAFVFSIFPKNIMQEGFIICGVILTFGTLFAMIEYFKIWLFFCKRFLAEEDNNK